MPSRRRYIALLAGLAGCSGGRATPSSTDSPAYTDVHTATRTRTGTPTDSPTESVTDKETSTETAVPPNSVDGAWTHPDHDAGHTGFTPGGTGPTDRPAELWSVDVGDGAKGPLVADGVVYTGAGRTLVALDAVTGELAWTRTLAGPDEVGPVGVVHGRLYLTTGSAVRAVSVADGSDEWRTTFSEYTTVVVDGAGAYGADSSTLVALDPATGRERWRTSVDAVGDLQRPALGPDAVYVADDASNGKVWSLARADGHLRWSASAGSHPGAVTVRDGTVFAGGFYGNVYGLSPADGERQWSANAGPAVGSILVGPRRLYAAGHGGDHAMACLDAWSGSTNWTANAYPRAAAGNLVLCDDGDHLVAISATLGEERWRVRAPTGGAAVVDDLCYVTGTRRVVALR